MPVAFIEDSAGGRRLENALAGAASVAVDCEAAGFHRYSDRLCLVQLSTVDATYILDPLATKVAPFLKSSLENPATSVVMHGAAYDLRLLKRDLGIHVNGLVDTQVSASLLGEPGIGLQALLERHLGVTVSKKFQRADWAQRPLSSEMLDYAAGDTRHLHALAEILGNLLVETGRQQWATEEYRWLVESAHQPDEKEPVDPVTKLKGAKALDAVACTALRAGLRWRDGIARSLDRAPFRVISDQALLEAAVVRPRSVGELSRVKGVSPRLADASGMELLRQYREIEAAGAEELEPYPAPMARAARPSPETEAAFEALKAERNRVASDLGLEKGRLMPNHLLMEVATRMPISIEELHDVGDIRAWQVENFGDRLLQALERSQSSAEIEPTPSG